MYTAENRNASEFLKIEEVCNQIRIAKSTVYKKINTEGFPKPVKLGPKIALWRAAEVRAWMEEKIAA